MHAPCPKTQWVNPFRSSGMLQLQRSTKHIFVTGIWWEANTNTLSLGMSLRHIFCGRLPAYQLSNLNENLPKQNPRFGILRAFDSTEYLTVFFSQMWVLLHCHVIALVTVVLTFHLPVTALQLRKVSFSKTEIALNCSEPLMCSEIVWVCLSVPLAAGILPARATTYLPFGVFLSVASAMAGIPFGVPKEPSRTQEEQAWAVYFGPCLHILVWASNSQSAISPRRSE